MDLEKLEYPHATLNEYGKMLLEHANTLGWYDVIEATAKIMEARGRAYRKVGQIEAAEAMEHAAAKLREAMVILEYWANLVGNTEVAKELYNWPVPDSPIESQ